MGSTPLAVFQMQQYLTFDSTELHQRTACFQLPHSPIILRHLLLSPPSRTMPPANLLLEQHAAAAAPAAHPLALHDYAEWRISSLHYATSTPNAARACARALPPAQSRAAGSSLAHGGLGPGDGSNTLRGGGGPKRRTGAPMTCHGVWTAQPPGMAGWPGRANQPVTPRRRAAPTSWTSSPPLPKGARRVASRTRRCELGVRPLRLRDRGRPAAAAIPAGVGVRPVRRAEGCGCVAGAPRAAGASAPAAPAVCGRCRLVSRRMGSVEAR
jgi:hypothetical protein